MRGATQECGGIHLAMAAGRADRGCLHAVVVHGAVGVGIGLEQWRLIEDDANWNQPLRAGKWVAGKTVADTVYRTHGSFD